MHFHTYFAAAERPVETCIVGAGGFGRSFLAHAARVPLISARVAVDVDAHTAARGIAASGVAPDRIRICKTAAEAKAAWAAGDFIAADDLSCVIDLPFDLVTEATGRPEPGARHAALAIEAGKHVALVSKEVDSVVGPGLARRAAEAGRVVTPVDGDQPSLLIGLVSWAELLGFELIAAGKASEYDFVYDSAAGRIVSNERTMAAPDFDRHWRMGDRGAAEIVAARAAACSVLPQRAVPDLCELQIVANATGLAPDRPDLHAPIARISEVATILTRNAFGGLLSGDRRIDVFHCLRAPDEASFAGGVFVIVRCEDRETWEMLAQKGHTVSRDGACAMLWLPRHLLGLEAATSVLDAAVHGVSGYGRDYRPRFDLVAVATADLAAGTRLTMGGHHHSIEGVQSELVPAGPLSSDRAAPFYLASDRLLARPVKAGETILMRDLEIEDDSILLALRRDQDAAFF